MSRSPLLPSQCAGLLTMVIRVGHLSSLRGAQGLGPEELDSSRGVTEVLS